MNLPFMICTVPLRNNGRMFGDVDLIHKHSKISIMNIFSPREQIVETVHKLFVYTDYQKWNIAFINKYTGVL